MNPFLLPDDEKICYERGIFRQRNTKYVKWGRLHKNVLGVHLKILTLYCHATFLLLHCIHRREGNHTDDEKHDDIIAFSSFIHDHGFFFHNRGPTFLGIYGPWGFIKLYGTVAYHL